MIIDALSLRLLTALTPKNSWRTLAGGHVTCMHVDGAAKLQRAQKEPKGMLGPGWSEFLIL